MRAAERQARFEQVRAALERVGLHAIVLRRPENFAWYSGGADNRVDHASPTGVAEIVVTPAGDLLLLDTAAARVFRFHLHLQ